MPLEAFSAVKARYVFADRVFATLSCARCVNEDLVTLQSTHHSIDISLEFMKLQLAI